MLYKPQLDWEINRSKGTAMSFEIDFNELGIELDEGKAAALKEALSTKHKFALDAEVSGLKAKRDELLASERKMKDALKQFEGIDPEKTRNLMAQLEQNEEARLIAEGKLDEVIGARTERMKSSYEKQLAEAQSKAEQANSFAEKFKGRVMSDEIRAAAAKAGLIESAVGDAVLRAGTLFQVDDNGNVIPRDGSLDDKGGQLTVETWLESMKDSAPHWFPAPRGSGAPGSAGSTTSPRAWTDAKTPAEKAAYLKRNMQK